MKKIRTNLLAQALIALAIWAALIGSLIYFTHLVHVLISTGYIILAYVFLFLIAALGGSLLFGFPPHNFYWGEYKTTFDKKRSRAIVAITVVIISLAISFFGSLLAAFITNTK